MKNKSILSVLFVLLSFSQILGQGPFYLKPNSSVTNILSWGDQPGGVGLPPTSFTTNNTIWNIETNPLPLSSTWDFDAASNVIVNVGNGTSAVNFEIDGGTISMTGTSSEVRILNTASISVTGPASFPASHMRPLLGSTFVFEDNAPNIPAFQGTNSSYKNMIIRKNSSLGATVVCDSILTIDPTFTLSLNNFGLTVRQIAGTGFLAAAPNTSGAASLTVNGRGGDLNLANGFGCLSALTVSLYANSFDLSMAPTTNLAATNMTIHGGSYNQTSGLFLLNGRDLFLSNLTNGWNINNTKNGKLGGGLTSDLHVLNTAITGSVTFEVHALSSFIYDNAGHTLNITNTGQDLQIFDSLSVKAGVLNTSNSIKIKSNDSKKGRLARVGTSASIVGTLKVETHLYGGNLPTGWANLGSPGLSGTKVSEWDTWHSSGKQSGMPMVCVGCSYEPTHFSPPFTSIYSWHEPSSNYVAAGADTLLQVGKGYWVYVGNGPTTTGDMTLLNSGVPATGIQNIPVTRLGSATHLGYNLVSNPYASPISWTSIYTNSTSSTNSVNFNGSIYIYNANGTWATYNAGAGSGTNGGGDIIPTGQGFLVALTSSSLTNSNLIIREDDKVADNTTRVLRPSQSSYNHFKLNIKGNGGDVDETMIWFHADATLTWDNSKDALKLFQSPGYMGTVHPYDKYTTISTQDQNGIDYSINGIPPLYEDVKVPILVKVMTDGTYTISASEYKHLSNCLTLKDKLLNVEHDLKSGDYVFQMNDTTSTARFELLMCKDAKVNPVGIQNNPLENNVVIGQDAEGVFVNTLFDRSTKATISAYNVVGQKIMEDIQSVGTVNYKRLPIDVQNQIVIIKVTSDQGTVTKKIIKN